MSLLLHEVAPCPAPESVASRLRGVEGVVLLRSTLVGPGQGRYSFLATRPFLRFRSFGPHCEVQDARGVQTLFGNPWNVLGSLLNRYELLEEMDSPFPLGGCFGWWGYDLKNAVEPRLRRRATNDLAWPDCALGFHDSLMAWDHELGKAWIISTGLLPDGSRSAAHARREADAWRHRLDAAAADRPELRVRSSQPPTLTSTFSQSSFIAAVERAQRFIRAGDIYQVNLAQRLAAAPVPSGWDLFQALAAISPAPFAAFLDDGGSQLVSSSPELFLRLSGQQILTRPIKGTRPRDADPTRDAQLSYELRNSAKENAELVMITDLLRNDLGRVCEYGSVIVPDLARLERFAQVQHLVSTVEGRLRRGLSHLEALRACFPGGSITGAPKIRAMEIIEELEPVTRGPYTGALGYLGFNRESQLSIVIRAALCRGERAWFHVGAGIVADSDPQAEYAETLAKSRGFLAALRLQTERSVLAPGLPA